MVKKSVTFGITGIEDLKYVAIPPRVLVPWFHTPQIRIHPYYNYYVDNTTSLMDHVGQGDVRVRKYQ
jgi:hypothetical protein